MLLNAAFLLTGFIIGACLVYLFVRNLKAGADKNLLNIIENQKAEIINLEKNHNYLEELLDTNN